MAKRMREGFREFLNESGNVKRHPASAPKSGSARGGEGTGSQPVGLHGRNKREGAEGGAKLSLVPIDVWIAAALAGTVVLLAFFGPPISAFAAIYIGLCAYIVIEIIYGELS